MLGTLSPLLKGESQWLICREAGLCWKPPHKAVFAHCWILCYNSCTRWQSAVDWRGIHQRQHYLITRGNTAVVSHLSMNCQKLYGFALEFPLIPLEACIFSGSDIMPLGPMIVFICSSPLPSERWQKTRGRGEGSPTGGLSTLYIPVYSWLIYEWECNISECGATTWVCFKYTIPFQSQTRVGGEE